MHWGQPYILVRWAGCDVSCKTWEPLDNLTNCAAAIFAFERSSGRPLPRPAPPQPAFAAPLPVPIPPAGFTIDAALLGDLRAELVGRTLLYWWPADGWQRGTVASICPRGAFKFSAAHVVAAGPTHGRRLRCAAPQTRSCILPRMATVGSCFIRLPPPAWTRLPPHPRSPAGRAARAPGPVGRWLVTAPGQGRAGCCVLFLVYIVEPGAR